MVLHQASHYITYLITHDKAVCIVHNLVLVILKTFFVCSIITYKERIENYAYKLYFCLIK